MTEFKLMALWAAAVAALASVPEGSTPLYPAGAAATSAQMEAQDDGDAKFYRSVMKAAAKSAREGQLTRRDVIRLRVAMLSPAFREKARELAVIQMAASGSESIGGENVPVDDEGRIVVASINWDQLLAFIEKLIPLLLQLLDAFSQDTSVQPSMWDTAPAGGVPYEHVMSLAC